MGYFLFRPEFNDFHAGAGLYLDVADLVGMLDATPAAPASDGPYAIVGWIADDGCINLEAPTASTGNGVSTGAIRDAIAAYWQREGRTPLPQSRP